MRGTGSSTIGASWSASNVGVIACGPTVSCASYVLGTHPKLGVQVLKLLGPGQEWPFSVDVAPPTGHLVPCPIPHGALGRRTRARVGGRERALPSGGATFLLCGASSF